MFWSVRLVLFCSLLFFITGWCLVFSQNELWLYHCFIIIDIWHTLNWRITFKKIEIFFFFSINFSKRAVLAIQIVLALLLAIQRNAITQYNYSNLQRNSALGVLPLFWRLVGFWFKNLIALLRVNHKWIVCFIWWSVELLRMLREPDYCFKYIWNEILVDIFHILFHNRHTHTDSVSISISIVNEMSFDAPFIF